MNIGEERRTFLFEPLDVDCQPLEAELAAATRLDELTAEVELAEITEGATAESVRV